MKDEQSELTGFDGVARLFPLPNVVLFPYIVQGLHIFEPRYREMTMHALAGDRVEECPRISELHVVALHALIEGA